MKPFHSASFSRRGIALLLVLAFIAIMAGLVVAFFATTSNTRREAAQFEAGVTVNQLADMATNIVMGQITDGTRSFEVNPSSPTMPGSGKRLTYTTQPGLVRSFDNAGLPSRAFKLYSSDTMVTPLGQDWMINQRLATEVPTNWPAKPARWVDLNAPVLTPSSDGGITMAGSSQKYVANYPILDPSAMSSTPTANDGVEGFEIALPPGYGGKTAGTRPAVDKTTNPQLIPTANTTGNPAPMPVQWLYVLRDGTITSPDADVDNNLTARWTGNFKPSKDNPIVGRVAFWTDDDSTKLNPNVHSEGVMWNKPVVGPVNGSSPYSEHNLTDFIPVAGEVQRYAGHPATVCLSAVFNVVTYFRNPSSDPDFPDPNFLSRFYSLTPRVSAGGSQGGTIKTLGNAANSDKLRIQADQDRLYATSDELLYTPDYDGIGRRIINPNITRADLEKMKFFLTTNAKSPETNLFNQPRISLWMPQQRIDANGSKLPAMSMRNSYDKLLAFCSTVGRQEGANEYFFQRASVFARDVNYRGERSDPYPRQVPSNGWVEPSALHPTLDWDLARNKMLYSYLYTMTRETVPGYGVKISDNYPEPQRAQLLTEMVDLLRGTNGYARTGTAYKPGDDRAGALPFDKENPRYDYLPSRQNPDGQTGESSIVPLRPRPGSISGLSTETKGFGRFPTITEAMLIFHNSSEKDSSGEQKMRMTIAFEAFHPVSGSWKMSPVVRYVVSGLGSLSVTADGSPQKLFPQDSFVNWVTARNGYGAGAEHNKAQCSGIQMFYRFNRQFSDSKKTMRPSGSTSADEDEIYPFISDEIRVKPDPNNPKKTFTFSGGDLKVEIHTGYAVGVNQASANTTLVQTINLKFPQMTLYLPTSGAQADFALRLNSLIREGDTVRSLEVAHDGPTKGDYRLVAAQPTVPPEFYKVYAGSGPDPQISHSYKNGQQGVLTQGNAKNRLVANGPEDDYLAAREMNGAMMSSGVPGDWDNGGIQQFDNFKHGAYINKPDDYFGEGVGGADEDSIGRLFMTPNRQIYSPVVFGSLPPLALASGGKPMDPWRTLLFARNPAAGDNHPNLRPVGAKRIPDHLLLDFFTMPQVEPFAISEPLATMGRVNLNYQIAPFSYIKRSTALHGVLKSTRIPVVPTSLSGVTNVRKAMNINETLRGFDERFDTPTPPGNNPFDIRQPAGVFRSASEICDMWLVPQDATYSQVKGGSYWPNYPMTGDNAREQPYGEIHSRVTVRSNTFTVHMRVQTLRKKPSPNPADWETWKEGVDTVVGDYRGSATIERYVDLGDPTLPDFADPRNKDVTLDTFYKFRVLQTKRFNP